MDEKRTRRRPQQLLGFLQNLQKQQYPVKTLVEDQGWQLWWHDLPQHPAVRWRRPGQPIWGRGAGRVQGGTASQVGTGDLVLQVSRPERASCPVVPEVLKDWVTPGWEDPRQNPQFVPTRKSWNSEGDSAESVSSPEAIEGVRIEAFGSCSERQAAWESWTEQRRLWVEEDAPAQAAQRIFEQLWQLHSILQLQAESCELVLADGLLCWGGSDTGIRHPILWQEVELQFDPVAIEFSVRLADRLPRLYEGLFLALDEFGPRMLELCKKELREGAFHPLGGEQTSEFLRRMVQRVSPHGRLSNHRMLSMGDGARMARDPVLLVVPRAAELTQRWRGLAEAWNDAGRELPLPRALYSFLDLDIDSDSELKVRAGEEADSLAEEPLFPLVAYERQKHIVERLTRQPGLMVEASGGAGKTQTMANLVCHFLALGKTVLATAGSSQVLADLRRLLPRGLHPLCYERLHQPERLFREAQSDFRELLRRLEEEDVETLCDRMQVLQTERKQLYAAHHQLAARLTSARLDEYRDVVIGSKSLPPAEAARRVAAGNAGFDWLPGPLAAGKEIPLTHEELEELYASNETVRPEWEETLEAGIPQPDRLPKPKELHGWIELEEELSEKELETSKTSWRFPGEGDPEAVHDLLVHLQEALNVLPDEAWSHSVMQAGQSGGKERQAWLDFLRDLQAGQDREQLLQSMLTQESPYLPAKLDSKQAEEILAEIHMHAKEQGMPGFWRLLFRGDWRRLLRGSRIAGKRPKTLTQLESLRSFAALRGEQAHLAQQWDARIHAQDGPKFSSFGDAPGPQLKTFTENIQSLLHWFEQRWKPIWLDLQKEGLQEEAFIKEESETVQVWLQRVQERLPSILQQEWDRRRLNLGTRNRAQALDYLRSYVEVSPETGVHALQQALTEMRLAVYETAWDDLQKWWGRRQVWRRRRGHLQTIAAVAPKWADAIQSRTEVHGQPQVPHSLAEAWIWRQCREELERRHCQDLAELQAQHSESGRRLLQVTEELVEVRAWHAQLRRTTPEQQEALQFWLQLMEDIPNRAGREAVLLRRRARRLWWEWSSCLPLWICPGSDWRDLAEDSEEQTRMPRFDLALYDGAQSCDPLTLVPMFWADRCVLFGDAQQLPPNLSGKLEDRQAGLCDEWLSGFPNREEWRRNVGLYRLGRCAWGVPVRLRDCFATPREILAFANEHCYEQQLVPLKEAWGKTNGLESARSHVPLEPAVVEYCLATTLTALHKDGAGAESQPSGDEPSEDKVWQREITSLILAMLRNDKYAERSMAVVILGPVQAARQLQSVLYEILHPIEGIQRRLLCGTPSELQGKAREVVLVLALQRHDFYTDRSDLQQKAMASVINGVREQLWFVHDFIDPADNGQGGDWRRKFLEGLRNGGLAKREMSFLKETPVTPFEQTVQRRLEQDGFVVHTQWPAGDRCVPLILTTEEGQRVALECEGDRSLSPEEMAAELPQLEQMQRLGWIVLRWRASSYYLDPDQSYVGITTALRQLGVHPVEKSAGSLPAVLDTRSEVVTTAKEILQGMARQDRRRKNADVVVARSRPRAKDAK